MSNKFIIGSLLAAAAIGAVVIFSPEYKRSPEIPDSAPVDASTPTSRINYFAAHGWEVEEISGKDIMIPSKFSENYEKYAALQDKQGLPLREYAGRDGKIYVYRVKNYSPNNKNMLAELLVCDNIAVASLVYNSEGSSQLPVN